MKPKPKYCEIKNYMFELNSQYKNNLFVLYILIMRIILVTKIVAKQKILT